jgi:serine/threonine-protein kinase
MLLPDSAPDAAQTERFRREAQAAASLNHPNIISVHDIGMSPDGKAFMVLEFIDGHSLEKRIETSGPLTNLKALSIFMQVASALQAAHDAGIIHRDIKPSNIMLLNHRGQDDFVKVVDFGLAKMMDEANEMKLTKSGEVFGTLLYMSPEQCLGHPLDQRTDIYSLGCTMYEAITGSPAFRGNTPYEVMSKHINEGAQSMPADLGVPPLLEALVLKALSKDRAHRQQNMHELQEELQAALASMF